MDDKRDVDQTGPTTDRGASHIIPGHQCLHVVIGGANLREDKESNAMLVIECIYLWRHRGSARLIMTVQQFHQIWDRLRVLVFGEEILNVKNSIGPYWNHAAQLQSLQQPQFVGIDVASHPQSTPKDYGFCC